MSKEPCKSCLGEHEPAPPGIYFDFKGWRFTPPFHCMCCGAETCYKQWAYGRSCGTCDTGACQARRLHSRLHEGKVYYGNAVLINEEEASRFGLTPDRMARVGEVAPEEWVHDTWPFLQEKAAEERDES
jgi:hypothetical protein